MNEMYEKKKNPLAKLGWLGLIGILGLMFGSYWMRAFFLFFFFFAYSNVTPDELFWLNVRKAATKTFLVSMILQVVGLTIVSVYQLYQIYELGAYPGERAFFVDGLMQLDPHFYLSIILAALFWHYGFIITLCTFFFILMYYRRKEKKLLGEESC